MSNLGILESKIQTSKNLAKEVFKSRYFLTSMNKWINDWNMESFKEYTKEELYGDLTRTPTTISPKELKEKRTIHYEDDAGYIKWRGKLSPEGWVHNILGTWKTDREMVNRFLEEMTPEDPKFTAFVLGYSFERSDAENLLKDITKQWEISDNNTFLFYTPKKDTIGPIEKILGYKKKKRI